jgi:hypothetical protein
MISSWYQASYCGMWRTESQWRSPQRCDGQKEYGVTRDFIVEGIKAGELEYREGPFG